MLPVLEIALSGEPNKGVIIGAWSEITTDLLTKTDLGALVALPADTRDSVVLCRMDFRPILIYSKLQHVLQHLTE